MLEVEDAARKEKQLPGGRSKVWNYHLPASACSISSHDPHSRGLSVLSLCAAAAGKL